MRILRNGRIRAGVVFVLGMFVASMVLVSPAAAVSPARRPIRRITIRSVLDNKCLDVAGASLQNGAPVIVWDCWCGANQRWY